MEEQCEYCFRHIEDGHDADCVVMLKLAASFAKDDERWIERYVARNSENMRRRVLAVTNGYRNVR